MSRCIFEALAERRFRKRAKEYLTEHYGDIFSWQAVLEIGEQSAAHMFSAAAGDMTVVCQAYYIKRKKGSYPEEMLKELRETAFCLAFMPAKAKKLIVIPKQEEDACSALRKAAEIPESVELKCV
ncbi:MAG: hypothetical protein E7487_02845 [Ruminococcaceae bacterium]|nr:hypothetical protein [Oscillospiraceae bacterium]